MANKRYEVRATFYDEEEVSLQVVGTRDEAITRFEARFPDAKSWYRHVGEPTVWDYDEMLVTHSGRMEECWHGDGHVNVIDRPRPLN